MASMLPLPDWVNRRFLHSLSLVVATGSNQPGVRSKPNHFLFGRMIGTTIAAFFFGAAFQFDADHFAFFRFRPFYPDLFILFRLHLPMKVKWIAWFRLPFCFCKSLSVRFNSRRGDLCDGELLDLFGPGIVA